MNTEIPTEVLNHPNVTTIHALNSRGEITATFHLFSTDQGTVVLYPTTPGCVWGYQLVG